MRPFYLQLFLFLLKWTAICAVVSCLAGSASAFFLISLDWATHWRDTHLWVVGCLPLAGLCVGLLYHYGGRGVEKGNNLLIERIHTPGKTIPWKMAPVVLAGTLLTHLAGGSAGREGTAVQMAGALADQFSGWFRLSVADRRILLIVAISAGFSSVFGTPLAGTLFALEVLVIGQLRYEALYPSLLAAVLADLVTQRIWQVGHMHYATVEVPSLNLLTLASAVVAGGCFGLTSRFFTAVTHAFSSWFKKTMAYPPLRTVIGGAVLACAYYLIYYFMHTTRYMGLGLPVIAEGFNHSQPLYDFIFKLILTAFTLSCGFKGGEVTPLFFIGATLGSAMAMFLPLPVGLLAGMGFVAVFAGAANTPIACTVMAMELFGSGCGVHAGIACITAYLVSGDRGIYASQSIGIGKHRSLLP